MTPDIGFLDVVGFFGVAALVCAYFANHQRWLASTDWRYPLINLIGSVLIGVSLIGNWNLPSATIQVFWSIISIYGIARSLMHRHAAQG